MTSAPRQALCVLANGAYHPTHPADESLLDAKRARARLRGLEPAIAECLVRLVTPHPSLASAFDIPALLPYLPEAEPSPEDVAAFFSKRNATPAVLLDCLWALTVDDDIAPALDVDLVSALRRASHGAPYDDRGPYDAAAEAAAADDLNKVAAFGTTPRTSTHSVVAGVYSATAILNAVGVLGGPDEERAHELEQEAADCVTIGLHGLAQARYLWAWRLLSTKTNPNDRVADTLVRLHVARANVLLHLDRPEDAEIEARAALVLDPDHDDARALLRD